MNSAGGKGKLLNAWLVMPWLVGCPCLVAWQQFVAAGSLKSFNNLPCLIEIRASAGSFTWLQLRLTPSLPAWLKLSI